MRRHGLPGGRRPVRAHATRLFNGDALRGRRVRAQRRLVDLAEDIGVSFAQISRWERGEREPSPENLKALAAALGCRPQDLLRSY